MPVYILQIKAYNEIQIHLFQKGNSLGAFAGRQWRNTIFYTKEVFPLLRIRYQCNSNHLTVRFAQTQLEEYLQKMAEQPGAVSEWNAFVELSVCSPVPELPQPADSALDDRYWIEGKQESIRIIGENPRCVLLGVYRLLFELGCRFPLPGKQNEWIVPLRLEQFPVTIVESAGFRHRGVCIEGANSLENILDFIDWLPKTGCNSFFLQHWQPEAFLLRWYTHENNPLLPTEELTEEQKQEMYRTIDSAIAQRGLLHHRTGHGWTCEAIGFHQTCVSSEDRLPEEKRRLLAEIDGVRTYWHGVPSNTNLCYSNPDACHAFVENVVKYANGHPEVDYLHIWLADEYNNVCECEECRKTTLSDQYIRLLNQIDQELTQRKLDTKLVMLLYQELLWPPVHEKLSNPDRFTMMFAPISRTFEKSYADRGPSESIPEYRRNRIQLPRSLEENLAFYFAWNQSCKMDCFDYDYPLGRAFFGDLGFLGIAQIISRDIHELPALGMNGYLSCQELRIGLPNTFPQYVMARTLWNPSLSFEALKEEYFSVVYGGEWKKVLTYLEQLSAWTSCDYFNGIGPRENPKMAMRYDQALRYVEAERSFSPSEPETPLQRTAYRLLEYHAEYCRLLLKALRDLSSGRQEEMKEAWRAFLQEIRQKEHLFQPWLDVYRVVEVATHYTGFPSDTP